ncbi:fibrillin-1-like [Watersipora subatra]|uniref:fibrillin-1-like n=1 Tax=Watersipora subatra TaxID=2589382 RepID=UPI00355BDBD3
MPTRQASNVSDYTTWGDSWRTTDEDVDPDCKDNTECTTTPPSDTCSTTDKQNAVVMCAEISEVLETNADAILCLSKLPPDTKDVIMNECVFDFCHLKSKEMICTALSTFAEQCYDKFKIAVMYRTPERCPVECKQHMTYTKACGVCELNCLEEQVDPMCEPNNDNYCQVECMCDENYRRHGDSCVPKQECDALTACEMEGTVVPIPARSTVLTEQCEKRCECRDGGNLECTDHTCQANSECVDRTCRCLKGFKLSDFNECEDINECLDNTKCFGKGARCKNFPGTYVCQCEDGFEFDQSGDCVNINECNGIAKCTANSFCVDKKPGYECRCKDGFKKEGDSCVDVDECQTSWHKCSNRSTVCNNTVGSYTCDCLTGYSKDNDDDMECKDVNECSPSFSGTVCRPNFECENRIGSYICSCSKLGYEDVAGICDNINECTKGTALCHEKATCKDTDGSYECTCIAGYVGDGKSCEPDLPTCDPAIANGCADFARCLWNAALGVSQCVCSSGFSGDGNVNCENINECELAHECSAHADCKDTAGNYECHCKTGFAGDGFNCNDEDECNYVTCGANAKCENEEGGYICKCLTGFSGSCENCVNDDECAMGTDDCHEHADCTDNVGSYDCKCKTGFKGDGHTSCVAEKPCAAGVDSCDVNAMCKDEANGEYSCECYPGYTESDNGTCIEADECTIQDDKCSENAECTYKDGLYTCQCSPGYVGDGVICRAGGVVCDGIICDPEARCRNGTCQCGYGFTGKGFAHEGHPGCIDVNECSKGVGPCPINSKCLNFPGTFLCACNEGFVSDGDDGCIKEENNPCAEKYCGPHSSCTPTANGPVCECYEGYIRDITAGRCFELDECYGNVHSCPSDSQCVNEIGGYTCLCNTGYTYDRDTNTCKDVDECYMKQYICSSEAECLNTDGGYVCRCYDSYEGDGKVCKPGDHPDCLENACGENSFCNGVVNGTAICNCIDGYVKRGSIKAPVCKDINECRDSYPCSENARCSNLPGSYNCECRPGYRGNGVSCYDVNECLDLNRCPKNRKCENVAGKDKCMPINDCFCGKNGQCSRGSEQCTCNAGYTYVDLLKEDKCQDIDECALGKPCRSERFCVNTEGGYECKCLLGDWDGSQCITNACEKGVRCHKHAKCSDVAGAAVCKCNDGYKGNGFKCVKEPEACTGVICDPNMTCVDSQQGGICVCNVGYIKNAQGRCDEVNECLPDPCGDHSTCIDRIGFYQCFCDDGYRRENRQCVNVDECTEKRSKCDSQADCADSEGGYTCTCHEGFVGDGFNCTRDILCERTGPCHKNAYCAKKADSDVFICTCKDGYDGDGRRCEDVKECALGTHYCHADADCKENEGSFTCVCKNGTTGNGRQCADVDECLAPTSPCAGEHMVCLNKHLSFDCVCDIGYELVGEKCVDSDECSPSLIGSHCPPPGECVNRDPGFSCTCPSGYTLTSTGCKDIDECVRGTHDCDLDPSSHIECANKPGSWECQCQKGYELKNATCEDIDECQITEFSSKCDDNAYCKNTDGNFECVCQDGFEGNGFTCIEKEGECETKKCSAKNSVCVLDTDKVEVCICEPGFSGDPEQLCEAHVCDTGSPCPSSANCIPDGKEARCECKDGFVESGQDCLPTGMADCLGDNLCGPNGTCEETANHYSCLCDSGYVFNQVTCVDVNECQLPEISCSIKRVCNNIEGGYECVCASGYMMDDDECVDIDECEEGIDTCGSLSECVNRAGGYSCKCRDGYEQNGLECQDVNECMIQPSICPSMAECSNNEGGFHCICPSGYVYVNESCADIDECRLNVCGSNSQCFNFFGGHECICNANYVWQHGSCQDVDECALGQHTCHEFADCENTENTYNCKCQYGFTGDGHLCQPLCTDSICPYLGQTCHVSRDGTDAECRCECTENECEVLDTMCDSEGTTHRTFREFHEWKCQTRSYGVKRAYWGDCQKDTCNGVHCEEYEVCTVGEKGAVCICPECTELDRNSGTVCSTLSNTYSSVCALKEQACADQREEKFLQHGACLRDCEMGEWSEFQPCDVTCGIGHQDRYRNVSYVGDAGQVQCLHNKIEHEVVTCERELCKGDACDGYNCQRPGAVCTVYSSGLPYCVCPTNCDKAPREEVCGQLMGREPRTYSNLCSLKHISCVNDLPYALLLNASCTVLPSCHTIPTFEVISVGNCQSRYHVARHECQGTCGDEIGECCRPSANTTIPVTLRCKNDSTVVEKVNSVESCACMPKE